MVGSFLTPAAYDKRSILVGILLGTILKEYDKAYTQNKRRAALSLGDYLWRFFKRLGQTGGDDNVVVRIAGEVKFRLIDLKKAKTSLAVIDMETDYNCLLPEIQRAFDRSASPGAKCLALNKMFPQLEQQIIKWDEESLPPYGIARRVVAEKYNCSPSTLGRLVSQAKNLSIEERQRRLWLQRFNVSTPAPPTQLANFPDYFVHQLLPLIPALKDMVSPSSTSSSLPAPLMGYPHALLNK